MDKNSILGLVLIGGILIGWLILNGPSKEELRKQSLKRDSLDKVMMANEKAKVDAAIALSKSQDTAMVKGDTSAAAIAAVLNPDSIRKVNLKNKFRDFTPAVQGENKLFVLENDKVKITFQSKGGNVASVELKEYTRPDKKTRIELLSTDSAAQGLVFLAYNNTLQIHTDSLYFIGGEAKKAGVEQTVVFQLPTSNPANYIEYIYTLKDNDYMLNCKIRLVNMQGIISQNAEQLTFKWKMLTPSQEAHIEKERAASTVYWKFIDEDSDYINPGKDDTKDINEAPVQWVAFKQQFFTAAVICDKGFLKDGSYVKTFAAKNSLTTVKSFQTELGIPYTHNPNEVFDMRYYFGPTHYTTLKKYDIELESMINIGWPVFNLINKWLVIPVFNAFSNSTISYGIIILLLTFIIKTLLFPVAWKTYMSSSKMRLLKPELDVINKKFPDTADAMKKNQESMALYKRAGASPFSGCIPALIQFPILIALLNFFPAAIELRQKAFLWAPDLSTYDSVWTFGNVPILNSIYGDHVSMFALLMFVSTIIYTWMNSKYYTPATQQQMPGMKFMMYFMPFIFLGFMNSYSSGLSWYYFLANVITFLQTWAMRKFVSDEKLRAQIDAHMRKPVKVSAFQQRLQDIAKQRQAPVKEKNNFMRKNFICILLIFVATLSFAQETKDAVVGLDKDKITQDGNDTSKIHWKKGGMITASGQQVSLTNWAAGGQSAMSVSALANLFANYTKGKLVWSTNLDLAYGVIKQASNRKWWKNDDRIQFNSKIEHYAFKDTYYAGLVDFKSQFAPGYNYPNDSTQISNFLAPAYVVAALGMDFKPDKYLSVFVAPVSGRLTIVNDDSLAKYGAFGVQKEIVDTTTHQITTHYRRVREQFGGYLKVMFKKEVMENVTFTTMLELFSDYLHNPQNLYVNWTTLTTMKVNKFISATLSTQLIYDDAVMIKDKDGKTGPRLQVKQVLGVGLSYKF